MRHRIVAIFLAAGMLGGGVAASMPVAISGVTATFHYGGSRTVSTMVKPQLHYWG